MSQDVKEEAPKVSVQLEPTLAAEFQGLYNAHAKAVGEVDKMIRLAKQGKQIDAGAYGLAEDHVADTLEELMQFQQKIVDMMEAGCCHICDSELVTEELSDGRTAFVCLTCRNKSA